jgi:predicted phosphodiesterase
MRKVLALLFLLCTAPFTSVFAQSSKMVMAPYLQAVSTNSIYVLVESTSAEILFVEYGLTKSYGSRISTESIEQTTEHTFVHNVKVGGLSPNTVYHYRALLADTASQDASFRTAPNPGTSFRFAWMADIRTTGYANFWNTPILETNHFFGWMANRRWGVEVHDAISKRIADANPVMSLYGGDLCINSSYSAFKDEFFRSNERALIGHVPFFNTPGNHEKWSQNTQAFTQAPDSPSGTQEYYSFDYGDMHVLVLNNEVDYNEGSPQYLYAQRDLSSTSKPWKIVIYHRPAYCAGGHGEDSKMITMSEKIFEPNHVDVVMNGHSHFFQHNLVHGIHHLVLGSAGAPLYKLGTAPYVIKAARDYSYGIIDVTPTSFTMTVYNDKGLVLDTLPLKKTIDEKPKKP